jgi:hypothetical protein
MFSRISVKPVIAAAVIFTLALASPAAAQHRASAQGGSECVAGFAELYNAIEPVDLFGSEETALLYLWEEEKLARDVYLALAARWQLPIFSNIAGAEQNHMDMVWKLFETYSVEHEFTDFTPGVFVDANLNILYGDLVEQGYLSLIDALTVGADIEDMDIFDLDQLLEATDNDHIELVAYNLAKGSRNHLRAFVRALAAQGITYSPQLLSETQVQGIIEDDWERGVLYDADGNEIAECGGGNAGTGQRRGVGGTDGQGNGSGSGSGECDGTGSNGGGNGNGECDGTGSNDGGNGNGDGECDGSGSNSGGNGGGNGGGTGGGN